MTDGRLLYAAMFGVAALAAFAKTFVYAWLLSPAQLGLVTISFLITLVGGGLAVGGIFEGLSREVPLQIGARKNTVPTRSGAYSLAAVLSIIVGIVLLLACLAVSSQYPEYRVLTWSAPLLVSVVAFNGMLCDLQTREHSVIYATVLGSKNIGTIALAFPLGTMFGAGGVIVAEVIANFGFAAVCLVIWSRDLRWTVRPTSHGIQMVHTGFPFAVSNFIQNLGMSIDRWAVQFALGTSSLGAYAFAMHFATVGLVLLNMVNLYAGPRALREFGTTRDYERLTRRTGRLALGTVGAFALGAIPFVLLYPMLVDRWLPQYHAAIPLAIWVYLGAIGITVSFYDIGFRAIGDSRSLVKIHTISLGVGVLSFLLLSISTASLTSYAAVFALIRCGTSVFGWLVCMRMSRSTR